MGVLLVVLIFVPVCSTLRYYSSSSVESQDHIDLQFLNIKHETYSGLTKRETDPLPSSFNIHIPSRDVYLTLHRNHLMSANVQLYPKSLIDNNILQQDEKSILGFYQDRENTGSFHVECLTTDCREFEVVGTFHQNNEYYSVEPDLPHPKGKVINYSASKNYAVSKLDTSVHFGIDYVYTEETYRAQKEHKRHGKRRHRRATGSYTVELLIVIDYSIYKFWYDRHSDITDTTQRKAAAINDIKRYYAFLLNGVDLRYQTLPGATYEVHVVFAGMYIAETQSQAPFTDGTTSQIDSDTLLEDFKNWVNAEVATGNLPQNDHAMLFTRHNITRENTRSITGLAYQSTICTTLSISIVQENFNFIAQTVAAHELGHSLGAVHDGDQNSCVGSNGFVMQGVLGVMSGDKARNPWIFSSCSTTEINDHIDDLSSNCMLSNDSGADRHELSGYTTPRIGQIYNVDDQCEIAQGSGSIMCRSFYNISASESVCTKLWCVDPSDPIQCRSIIPAPGTSCGNKKWCSNDGRCVDSTDAPATGSCVFGDQPGVVENGQNCTELIRSTPFKCYTASISSKCCLACSAIETGNSACLYGNQGDCFFVSSNTMCYTASVASYCCGTCLGFQTDIPNCKYGDRHPACPTISSMDCYLNNVTCCEHCAQYKTGSSDCQYGDRVTGCTQADCASSPDDCCETCYVPPSTTTTTTITTTTTTQSTTVVPTTFTTTTTVVPSTTSATTTSASTTTTSTCSSSDQSGVIVNGKTCTELADTESWRCYTEGILNLCCQSCSAVETGIPGCPYGDRISTCTLQSCNTEATDCCLTCHDVTTIATTTPTITTTTPTTTIPTTTTPTTTTTTPTTSTPTTTTPTTTTPTTTTPTTTTPTTTTPTTTTPTTTTPTTTTPTTTTPTTTTPTTTTPTTTTPTTTTPTTTSPKTTTPTTTTPTTTTPTTTTPTTTSPKTTTPTTTTPTTTTPTTTTPTTTTPTTTTPTGTAAPSQSTTTSAPPETEQQTSNEPEAGVIGGIVGGVIFLLIVVIAVICYMRRCSSSKGKRSLAAETDNLEKQNLPPQKIQRNAKGEESYTKLFSMAFSNEGFDKSPVDEHIYDVIDKYEKQEPKSSAFYLPEDNDIEYDRKYIEILPDGRAVVSGNESSNLPATEARNGHSNHSHNSHKKHNKGYDSPSVKRVKADMKKVSRSLPSTPESSLRKKSHSQPPKPGAGKDPSFYAQAGNQHIFLRSDLHTPHTDYYPLDVPVYHNLSDQYPHTVGHHHDQRKGRKSLDSDMYHHSLPSTPKSHARRATHHAIIPQQHGYVPRDRKMSHDHFSHRF